MNKKLLITVFSLLFIAYLLAGFYWRIHQRPTGDEPHYLIISQSIIVDRDLDLKNNYDNRDYKKWGYPAETLDRHISSNSRAPYEYSIHSIGWPIIIAPLMIFNHLIILKFFTAIIALLIIINLYLLLKKFMADERQALMICLILALSPPLLIYSTQLGNELFAAFLVLYAFRKIIEKTNSWPNELLTILAIAYLPWLHIKYLLLSFVLLVFWLLKNWSQKTRYLGIIYFVSLALITVCFWLWYGSMSPNAQYPLGTNYQLSGFLQGGLALILDRSYGLLPFAPIYFFSVAGLYFLFWENKKIFWTLLTVFLALFLVNSAGAIYIGWVPEGRFFVPVIALLGLPLALSYKNLKFLALKILFWLVSAWGILSGIYLIRHPNINYAVQTLVYFKNIGLRLGVNLTNTFPHLLEMEKYPKIDNHSKIVLAIWIAIILILCGLIIWQSPKKTKRT